jgi:hypothetical protein
MVEPEVHQNLTKLVGRKHRAQDLLAHQFGVEDIVLIPISVLQAEFVDLAFDPVEILQRATRWNEVVGVPRMRIDLAEIGVPVHRFDRAEMRGGEIRKPCLQHGFRKVGIELSLDPLHQSTACQVFGLTGTSAEGDAIEHRFGRRLRIETCRLNGRLHFATKILSHTCHPRNTEFIKLDTRKDAGD